MTRRRSTAHVIGVTTICSDYCCHYLRLKIDCSLNLLLTEIFKRRIYIVDETPFRLSRRFPLETRRLNHLLYFIVAVFLTILNIKSCLSLGKSLHFIVVVNCPLTEKYMPYFRPDNIFFRSTYRRAR